MRADNTAETRSRLVVCCAKVGMGSQNEANKAFKVCLWSILAGAHGMLPIEPHVTRNRLQNKGDQMRHFCKFFFFFSSVYG